jgi:hypothetical protein
MSELKGTEYDQRSHSNIDDRHRAATAFFDVLFPHFPHDSILEMGCGHGAWLEVAKQKGASEIQGIDGPWTHLNELRISPEHFQIHDFTKPLDLKRKFAIVLSLEVGEHLPPQSAGTFVESIIRHGDLVVFGAAIPWQGGYRHHNERWQSYWADLFGVHGYRPFDLIRPAVWNVPGVPPYYKQNALVYVSSARADLAERAGALAMDNAQHPMLDVVHPDMYGPKASYESISLKNLVPRLPAAIAEQVGRIIRR